jgi:hypothetical protein
MVLHLLEEECCGDVRTGRCEQGEGVAVREGVGGRGYRRIMPTRHAVYEGFG